MAQKKDQNKKILSKLDSDIKALGKLLKKRRQDKLSSEEESQLEELKKSMEGHRNSLMGMIKKMQNK